MVRKSTVLGLAMTAILAGMSANVATASPGPPPPEYVSEIAKHVVPTLTQATFNRYAGDFGDDLRVSLDGKEIASSKANWLALERRRLGMVERHVLGYTNGYDSILVFDRFDDRSDLPDIPTMHFDARYKTRAVQYQIGADHMIHTILITQVEGPLQTPK